MYKSRKVSTPFTPEVKRFMDRVGSRKRSAYIVEMEAGTPVTLYSYWDGGSRDEYRAWNAQGQEIDIPVSGAPGFTQPRGAWTPQVGDVLVSYGTFLGKPSTPHITFYREDA